MLTKLRRYISLWFKRRYEKRRYYRAIVNASRCDPLEEKDWRDTADSAQREIDHFNFQSRRVAVCR